MEQEGGKFEFTFLEVEFTFLKSGEITRSFNISIETGFNGVKMKHIDT